MRTLRAVHDRASLVGLAVVVFLVMGAESLRRRSEACRERAAHHAFELSRLTTAREDRLRQADADPDMRAVALFDAQRHDVAMAWHADRQSQARDAAWRPWRAIASNDDRPPWPPIPPDLYPAPKSDPPAGPSRPGTLLVDTFLFHPMRYPEGEWARRDPTIEVTWFRLRRSPPQWLVRHGEAAPRGVLYCRERGNISGRRWVLDLFRDRMGPRS